MKKSIFISLFGFCVLILNSCSSNDPEKAAIEAINYMLEEKYEKLLNIVAFPESYSDVEAKLAKERMENLFKELKKGKYIYRELEENGGVSKIYAVKNDDGSTVEYQNYEKTEANVRVKVICKNGDTLNFGNTPLILQNGKWKLHINN